MLDVMALVKHALTWVSVNNDFHQPKTIFKLFEGLEVKNLGVPIASQTNGVHAETHSETNGASHVNRSSVAATA